MPGTFNHAPYVCHISGSNTLPEHASIIPALVSQLSNLHKKGVLLAEDVRIINTFRYYLHLRFYLKAGCRRLALPVIRTAKPAILGRAHFGEILEVPIERAQVGEAYLQGDRKYLLRLVRQEKLCLDHSFISQIFLESETGEFLEQTAHIVRRATHMS